LLLNTRTGWAQVPEEGARGAGVVVVEVPYNRCHCCLVIAGAQGSCGVQYTAAGASLHVRSLSCCCVLPARCRGQCVLALQRGLCIRYLLNRSAPGETTAFQPPHPFHARTGLPLARLHVVAPTYACPHIVHLVPPALPHCSGRSNGRVPTLTARWGRLFSR
jgi:hypothetical protein